MSEQEYTHAQTVEMVNMLAKYGIKAEVADNAPPPDPYEDDPRFLSLDQFPEFLPEDENDDVLVRGRWLERGGAAFIVSTAGTGKSIHSIQTALCWSEGIAFAGLRPRKKLNVWLFQSEDSPTRVTIDREDIVAELTETHPEVKWRETCRTIRFVKIHGEGRRCVAPGTRRYPRGREGARHKPGRHHHQSVPCVPRRTNH